MQGYVRLHREIMESKIWDNPKLYKVYSYCLMKASHKEHEVLVGLQKVRLQPGQFVYGRDVASRDLKLPPSTVNDYMNYLKLNNKIDMKPNNKFTVVTVVNWGLYQYSEEISDSNSDTKTDSKATTNRQQSNTYKNGKNDSNGKEDSILSPDGDKSPNCPHLGIMNLYHRVCTSLPKITEMTEERQRHMKVWWAKGMTLDKLEQFFKKVEDSDFLSGRITGKDGKSFKCGFDWIIKPTNRQKIIEGNYDNDKSKATDTQQ